jgi:hypothetical protein
MAVAITFYQAFKANAVEADNLGSDTYKIMLTDAAPNAATHAVKADVTQIASGNGYTTDGNACTVSSHAQSGGTYKLVLNSPTAWTGGPSAMAQFRYAVLYDVTTGNLVGYYDYGSEVTLNNGDTFTITLDGTNGVLQLS